MHVFFSGIGGTGIGPLSLIAHRAGVVVSGSDKQDSNYIHYLQKNGIADIHIGQEYDDIASIHARTPIDWYVYSSAIAKEQADPPELRFCREHGIKTSKRDEYLSKFLEDNNLKLIAIAGTHGKTTTTAMMIWAFKQLGILASYSVGAKLSFGDMGDFVPGSEYFVYECDEYDRNFLAYKPFLSLITGIDWDHPDTYPTRDEYYDAFHAFLNKGKQNILWPEDAKTLGIAPHDHCMVVPPEDGVVDAITLPGEVNRRDAALVVHGLHAITGKPLLQLTHVLNTFPGVSRRFEQVAPNIYSDYAHTPPKIKGALQLAHEIAGENVIVIYEGLHNTRQHFIKNELKHLFDDVKQLYIVPSYLARENPNLPLLSPADIRNVLSDVAKQHTVPAALDSTLQTTITQHAAAGDTVVCISAGGGGSLDEWLRQMFNNA
jgi:UDP-N-acetylmuramate--alanine ligase